MKIVLSLFFTLVLHSLLFISFSDTNSKVEQAYSFNIDIVKEIIKLENKKIPNKASSFKNNKNLANQSQPSPPTLSGDRLGDKYLQKIRSKIILAFGENAKLKMLKVAGESKVSLLIKSDGSYLIKSLEAKNRFIHSETKRAFNQISQFEPFPKSLSKQYLEPVFTFVFNFDR